MNFSRILCALSIAIISSVSLAQDVTDVEAKPYGSYTGSAIDTVDLVSGNLMLHIPLISYPQKGTLPPLSFSVELNNAPYAQTAGGDGSGSWGMSVKYDTAPPGAVFPAPPTEVAISGFGKGFQFQNVGAYITSSFAGGIVTGQNQSLDNFLYNYYAYSLIDPDGTTHELESDSSSPDIYRTPDGSGYAFLPDDSSSSDFAYDWHSLDNLFEGASTLWPQSANYWIPIALDPFVPDSIVNGTRHGTVLTPTGTKYSSTFRPFPISSSDLYSGMPTSCTALTTTATDPTGNTITRSLWDWSGCTSKNPSTDISAAYASDVNAGFSHPAGYPAGPYYIDSVGRIIPDVLTMQAILNPEGSLVIPWSVPGPGGNALVYSLQYTPISNADYTSSGQLQLWNDGWPDPSVNISGAGFASGLALASITLPGFTPTYNPELGPGQPRLGQWQFIYSPNALGQIVAGDPSFNHYTTDEWDGARSGPDLLQVITPTGGEIDYTYTTITDNSGIYEPDIAPYRCSGNCHAVSSRTVKDNNGGSYTTTYTYGSYTSSSQISGCPMIDSVLFAVWTKETDSLGNDTVHSFCALDPNFSNPTEGRFHEIETQYFQGPTSSAPAANGFVATSSSTLLKTVTTPSTSWQFQADIPYEGTPIINALPNQIVTTTPGGSTTEGKGYSTLFNSGRAYCAGGCSDTTPPYWIPVSATSTPLVYTFPVSYQSPTSDAIYPGTTATGTPLRETTTTFEFQSPQYSNLLTANMIALPRAEQSLDPATGSPLSTTMYSYDDASYIANESNCSYPTQPCGDLTKTTRSLNTGTNVTTTTSYVQGMPVLKTDANGNQTSISYQCQGMYPLSITKAYGSTTTLPQTTSYTYDCATNLASSSGVVTGVTDPNGVNTQYSYANSDGTPDSMGRLRQVQYGVVATSGGSTAQSTTTLSYPSLTEVDISQQQSTSVFLTSKTFYDGLGRTIQQVNPAGDSVLTTYGDESTQPYTVSNPSPAGGNPSTDGITTYAYDALGRVVLKTNQDNTAQSYCYDSVADVSLVSSLTQPCSFSGTGSSWINSSDESGHLHQQNYDSVGQLIAVAEPNPTTGSMTTGALGTAYSYDPLGNLTKVVQSGSRTRTFTYDSLSRLICSSNPENSTAGCPTTAGSYTAGTDGYIYDANGNLSSKTDARGITVSYSYDALNRLLSKSYGPTSTTPASCYQYDQAPLSLSGLTFTNPIGHLTAEWTQKGACPTTGQLPGSGSLTSRVLLGYDFMGRLTREQQCTFSTCATPYNLAYSYDLAGHVTQSNNGVGTIYWQSQYDPAGRLSSVTGYPAWIDPEFPSSLFNSISYGPAGITSWQNAAWAFKKDYDTRLRVVDGKQQ